MRSRNPGSAGPLSIRIGSQFTPGVKVVLGIFCATWVLALLPEPVAGFVRSQLVLVPSQALGPKPWQLLTGPLLIIGANPLLGLINLLFLGLLLYSLGSAVEGRLGKGPFLRLLLLASVLSALLGAAVGRLLPSAREVPILLSGEPVFLAVLACFARLMGHHRMTLWGVGQPVSGRAIAYFFIGLVLCTHLLRGLMPDLVAAITATGVGLSQSGQGRLRPILTLRKWIKEWQIRRARRRYKVLDGGLLSPRPRRTVNGEDRWVN
jgi:membrane associated rhomboid family serine protease